MKIRTGIICASLVALLGAGTWFFGSENRGPLRPIKPRGWVDVNRDGTKDAIVFKDLGEHLQVGFIDGKTIEPHKEGPYASRDEFTPLYGDKDAFPPNGELIASRDRLEEGHERFSGEHQIPGIFTGGRDRSNPNRINLFWCGRTKDPKSGTVCEHYGPSGFLGYMRFGAVTPPKK